MITNALIRLKSNPNFRVMGQPGRLRWRVPFAQVKELENRDVQQRLKAAELYSFQAVQLLSHLAEFYEGEIASIKVTCDDALLKHTKKLRSTLEVPIELLIKASEIAAHKRVKERAKLIMPPAYVGKNIRVRGKEPVLILGNTFLGDNITFGGKNLIREGSKLSDGVKLKKGLNTNCNARIGNYLIFA